MTKFLRFTLLLIAFLSLFPLYTRYKAASAPIPAGVYLAGLELSHLQDAAEIEKTLVAGFQEPVAIYYHETRLVLRPQEIDFQIDTGAMLAEAQQYLNGPDFIDIALRQLAGLPQRRRDVALRYTYNPQKLATWLWQVGQDLDHSPNAARALPPQWNWRGYLEADPSQATPPSFVGTVQRDWQWTLGTAGQTLLIDESKQPILDALTDSTFARASERPADPQPLGRRTVRAADMRDAQASMKRTAHLVLQESPPPSLSMEALGRVLDSYTSDFPGFAAIYVQDLTTGEEANVDVDVAFSGMSTMKVAIGSAALRQLDDFHDVGQWMDYALGESSNFAANLLLQWVGQGDIYAGGRQVTEMMQALGFTNSFIQTGYEDRSDIRQIVTSANSRTDWNTNPDTHLQSTPADMGRLLAEIYRCQLGQGLLIETFGKDITPEECRVLLFYMSHNEFTELVWGGLPRPTQSWIIHKHGFVNEAHSDLALVWGPTGPYVIAVYLWRAGWMDWDTSNSTMKDISRIVWNFFAYKAELEGIETPAPPLLSPPPNYIPVNHYRSRAATGG